MEYRLNKYISSSGVCSRREADKYIEEGKVTINGKRASVGMRVLPGQQVRLNGHLIETDTEPVYIAFNKPVGVVSTTDTQDKDNIIDFISHEQRIFPIGRLDKESQGLILLTNDGDIVNKILRAGNHHKKEYIVTVNKPITEEFVQRMSQGVPILDRVTRKCQIRQINPYTFQITLIQGLNRQIRRMCEYFDYEVTKLERIQIMNISLGNLGQGNWRNLTEQELEGLFDMIEDSENSEKPKKTSPSKSKSSAGTNSAKNEGRRDGRTGETPRSGGAPKRSASSGSGRNQNGSSKGRSRATQNSSSRKTHSSSSSSRGGSSSRGTSSRGGSKRR